jgi:hypothetical protein
MTLQNRRDPKRKSLRGFQCQQEEYPCYLLPWSLNRSIQSKYR